MREPEGACVKRISNRVAANDAGKDDEINVGKLGDNESCRPGFEATNMVESKRSVRFQGAKRILGGRGIRITSTKGERLDESTFRAAERREDWKSHRRAGAYECFPWRSVIAIGVIDRNIRRDDGFETPYGLELLSSVHWVAATENQKTEDKAKSLACSITSLSCSVNGRFSESRSKSSCRIFRAWARQSRWPATNASSSLEQSLS